MKKLTFKTTISRPVEQVFNKIMDPTSFADWAKAWGDGMTMSGDWQVGGHMIFADAEGSGTKARIEAIVPNDCIKMRHVAMVNQDGAEVTELDEVMRKWIGAREDYFFTTVSDSETELTVVIEADEAFEPMMQAWNQALVYFKEICEAS